MVFQQHMIQVRFLVNKLFSSREQLIIFGFVPIMNSFSLRWSSSRLCNNNCWRRLVNRIVKYSWKKPDLFTILLFVHRQNTEYKKRPLTYYGKSFSRFFLHLFNEIWISLESNFFSALPKESGTSPFPTWEANICLPSGELYTNKQTMKHGWLLTTHHGWLLLTDQQQQNWWKAHKMGLLTYNQCWCLTS